MAKRDIEKIAEKTTGEKNRIPTAYDMTGSELFSLTEKARKDAPDAILTAFRAGFVLGHRATKAGKYTESR